MSVSLAEISGGLTKDNGENQLVVFTLAGCELAVGIHQVREIIRVSEITMMPKAPRFLEGIINLRGRIIPVLDLKKRFDMPLVDKTDETRVLVVEIKDQWMGLLVDKVVEVLRVPLAAVQPPTEAVLTIAAEYIAGVAALEDRLIVLFQLEKLFTFDEIKSLPNLEVSS